MFYYRICIQFADPAAPNFDDDIMPVFDRALDYYNTKSLIAKNPKKIVDKAVIDSRTLQLMLQSEIELPYPSKALRLFSRYLVDPETEGALNQYIYGKQLFKMQAEKISEPNEENKSGNVSAEGIDALRVRAIKLILKASEPNLRKAIALLEDYKV